MALARTSGNGWQVRVEPVGPVETLLARLTAEAAGGPVAFGIDCPIGLPRRYAALHAHAAPDFPAFLNALPTRPGFFAVADTIEDVSPARPFYPRRPVRGMTRLSLAEALGLSTAADLSRACDKATADRPAGAPLFWTLGANQSGKAAIAAWRDLFLPAIAARLPVSFWPFEGPFRTLLQPGRIAIAETYPADALRQLGLRLQGSKRRQADRAALAGGLRSALETAAAVPDDALGQAIADGFGRDPAGEDRLDCLLGLLCLLGVLAGRRPDTAPPDPWLTRWEGWVLGQSAGSL